MNSERKRSPSRRSPSRSGSSHRNAVCRHCDYGSYGLVLRHLNFDNRIPEFEQKVYEFLRSIEDGIKTKYKKDLLTLITRIEPYMKHSNGALLFFNNNDDRHFVENYIKLVGGEKVSIYKWFFPDLRAFMIMLNHDLGNRIFHSFSWDEKTNCPNICDNEGNKIQAQSVKEYINFIGGGYRE